MDTERVNCCLNEIDELAKRMKGGKIAGATAYLLSLVSAGQGVELESLLKELREALGFAPTKSTTTTSKAA